MRFTRSFQKLTNRPWRNPWLVAFLACVATVILAGSFPYQLSRNFIEPRLQQALKRDTGYSVENMKSASFSAFPWPNIRIEGLELAKPGQNNERLSIPVLKARLNLAAWISGSPRITGLTLMRPRMNIAGNAELLETEAMSATVFHELGRNRRPELSNLRIISGTVLRNNKAWITNLNLNVINLVGHDMRVRANASVLGLPVRISSDINQTETSTRRPIRWTIATGAGEASFSGLLMGTRSLDSEGTFSLVIKDAGLLTDRLRLDHAFIGFLNGMSISGETKVALPLVQIREATVMRGTEKMTGSLEFNLGRLRPAISATLHSDKLDLVPLISPFVSPMTALNGSWSSLPFSHRWMQTAQLDLRLSSEEMKIGRTSLLNAALSAQMNADKLEIILNDARLNGGTAKGRMSFNGTGAIPEIRMSANVERLDYGALLTSWTVNRLKGMGSLNFQIETSGRSMFDIAGNINGRAHVAMREGEIAGFDLNRLATKQGRNSADVNLPAARTKFQRLQSDIRINNGTIALADGFVSNGPLSIPITGMVQIQSQMLDITLKLPPIPLLDAAGETGLRIEGPWSNPAFYPDLTGQVSTGKAGRT